MIAVNAESNVNRRALTVGMIIAGGAVLGVLMITDMLSGGGNSLAKLARVMAVAGLVAGFLNPRLGVYLLIISTGYLDLLKRMLVFYDRPTMIDLYYVLGVAPLIMAGVMAGVIVGGLFGKFQLRRVHWLLLAFGLCYNGLMAFAAMREEGLLKAGSIVANDAFYCLLLFAVPALFQTLEDFWKLIRFAIWVFVPVALYGIYQGIFGLSMFEIAYLKSGLTIMVKELDDIKPRPFSTLNSAGALAFANSTMFVLSLLPWLMARDHPLISKRKNLYLLFAVIFMAGLVMTLVRSGHIVWMIALPGLYFFTTKKGTVTFYTLAVGGYLTLVISCNWVLKMLPVWDAYLPKDVPFLHQLTRIQTFSDRLKSFDQLKHSSTYSWFGLEQKIFSHDAITGAIIRHGVVPVAVLVVVAMFILVRVHRTLLSSPSELQRRAAALFLGVSAATFAGGALVGGIFGTFPTNVYWWMMMGGLAMMTLARGKDPVVELEAVAARDDVEEEKASPEVPKGRERRGIPFRRSGAVVVAGASASWIEHETGHC